MKGAIIKYFGSKATMFNKIIEHFPEQGSYDTYIEPFSGTWSIGFNKPDCPVEIYNDIEQNVYSLYKVISDKNLFPLFKDKCDLIYYNEDLRKDFKEKLKNDNLSIVDRAFMFFYVNRTSHNGLGGFSLNTVIRRNMSKSISDFLSCIDRLPEFHQRLSKVVILNTDALELIKKYDRPNVMFYCDSPYSWTTRTSVRYKHDMNEEKQLEYLNIVIKTKAKILVSGYNCETYSILDKNGFTRHDFEVNTVDGNRKPKIKVESLWKNY